jgi:hypothetical protein
MKKYTKLLLLAVAVVTVGLLASSCLVVGDTQIRYTWQSTQQNNIVSIAASFADVKDWYDNIWYPYYPKVWNNGDGEVSHKPLWNGSTEIENNIWSSTLKSTQYKGKYFPISSGKYTAICTVLDPIYGDTFDIVANYEIKEYLYAGSDPSTTYYELAFDVKRFLDGGQNPDKWWYFDDFNNKSEPPKLTKTPTSKPFLKVVEENDVTYLIFRRPEKN